MSTTHLRYLAMASRWQLIVAGALLGAAAIAPSHLLDAGPFASPHAGVALGTVAIAIGAAFTLDDPAASTLAPVPVSLLRRALRRMALAAAIAAVALGGLALVAWERLAYAELARQAAGLTAVAIAGTAVAGRLAGWSRPGVVGAAVVAVLLVTDGLSLLPGDVVLVTGGSSASGDTVAAWAVLAAVAAAALAWATRDPATRRP